MPASHFRWIESQANQFHSAKAIETGVQVNNLRAIRFWQRLSYAIISGLEERPDQTTVFHLRKPLKFIRT